MNSVSVIISTFNQPAWLEKVIIGFENQTEKKFNIVIADDGSSEETANLIQKYKKRNKIEIIHIWHKDNGFQKTKILNKSILATQAEYLIFIDGDCIPRKDFVDVHIKNREKGYFLSGGYFKLPMHISKIIAEEDICNEKCFDLKWLKSNGLKTSFKNNKLSKIKLKTAILNCITTTEATWNGHNASGWKQDILKVNGFDERMQYGGEDRELGERLFNLGIKAKQLRYSAICVHLDHERGYVKPEMIEKNLKIRKQTKKTKSVWTDFGIS